MIGRNASPLCARTSHPGADDPSFAPRDDVREVQLVLDSASYARLAPEVGHDVELRGKIFGADNPERWTPVIVLVAALSSAGYFEEALAESRAARAEIRGIGSPNPAKPHE